MRFVGFAFRTAVVLTLVGPAPLLAQSAGGVRCNDGTYSKRSGIGACWFSGGVAVAPKPVAAAPASSRAKAVAEPRGKAKGIKGSTPSSSRSNAKPDFDRKRDNKKAKKEKEKKAKKDKKSNNTSANPFLPATSSSRPSITKHAPKAKPAPRGATARCMDGSYSYATRKKKACSKQGGVAGWLRSDIPPE